MKLTVIKSLKLSKKESFGGHNLCPTTQSRRSYEDHGQSRKTFKRL
jgi:hypothetical protein